MRRVKRTIREMKNAICAGVKNAWIKTVQTCSTEGWLKRTVLPRRDAVLWLPGVDKELAAIGSEKTEVVENGRSVICYTDFKLKMSEEEIAKHVWSQATRVALIKREILVLAAEVCTVDEFDALLSVSPKVTFDTWRIVFRKYTPKASQLAAFLAKVTHNVASAIVAERPQAFNDAKAWQLLGLSSEKSSTSFDDERQQGLWAHLYSLAYYDPKRWVCPCVQIIMNTKNNTLPGNEFPTYAEQMLHSLVSLGISNGVDMSEHLLGIYAAFPKLYANMRADLHIGRGKSSQVWFCKAMLPFLLKKMMKVNDSYLHSGEERECLGDTWECVFMLRVAINCLSDKGVYDIISGNLKYILEKTTESFGSYVVEKLIENAHVSAKGKAEELYQIWINSKDMKYASISTLLRSEALVCRSVKILLVEFPFAEGSWTENQKRVAYRILVQEKAFPMGKLNTLSSTDKEYVYECMRTQSQIQTIRTDNTSLVAELVAENNLTVEAEYFWFTYVTGFRSLKEEYLAKKKVSMSTFINLTRLPRILAVSDETGLRYLQVYANNHGLSKEEYAYILQSPCYSTCAHLFEKYLKK